MVLGKDGYAAGANGGVVFWRNGEAARALLSAWWAWPDEGADGALDLRHRWEASFPQEQAALNHEDGGLLLDARARCMRVVPATDLFVPPGALTRHFTGPCPLAAQYEPADGSYLQWGPTRKCRCLLSHFGPAAVRRLLDTPTFNQTRCQRKEVRVQLPRAPREPTRPAAFPNEHAQLDSPQAERAAAGLGLAVTYSRHCTRPRRDDLF